MASRTRQKLIGSAVFVCCAVYLFYISMYSGGGPEPPSPYQPPVVPKGPPPKNAPPPKSHVLVVPSTEEAPVARVPASSDAEPTPQRHTDGAAVKILVTKYPHLNPAWFSDFPCSVKCVLVGKAEQAAQGLRADLNKFVDEVDAIQLYGNDDFSGNGFYNILENPKNKILMVTNYNNIESPHVGREKKRWIAQFYDNPKLWDKFHIVNTHQQLSIVPFQTYTHVLSIPNVAAYIQKNIPATRESKTMQGQALACFISSHKGHTFDRLAIAVEISKHVPVHVYGKIKGQFAAVSGTPRPDISRPDCDRSTWYDPRATLCLIRPYPFNLAFENSRANDYGTEKVYDPLLIGSVPVYKGAPNIDNLVPPRSIIKVDDFPDLAAVAAYMKCVWEKPHLYEFYLNWRNRTSASWDRIQNSPHPLCSACRLIAEKDPILYNVSARFPRGEPLLPENENSQAPFKECAPDLPNAR